MARASTAKLVEGVSGTVLPAADFPLQTLVCPWCPGREPFKASKGLRGHAWKVHRIKWVVSDSLLAPSTIAKRKEFGPRALIPNSPQEAGHMSRWHKIAAAQRVLGKSNDEIAAELGKRPQDVKEALASPAVQKYTEWVVMKAKDPETRARWIIQADAADAALATVVARDWAVEAKDYDAVHRISKDILKANKVFDSDEVGKTLQVIQIHVGKGNQLDYPVVETSYIEVEAEVVED